MSTAREQILARIRATPRGRCEAAARAYRRTGALSPHERLVLFQQRVSEYQADVHLIEPDHIAPTIETICAARGARRLAIAHGLPNEWRPDGVDLVRADGLDPRTLNTLDGAITGCTAAIAETGTIILSSAPADGNRAITLVPDLHICIVGETQIVELVPEAIALLQEIVATEPRPVTLVSGPSATSDIELNRVEGVHGPRTLVTLIATEAT